mgnify:CR=1 FL=1
MLQNLLPGAELQEGVDNVIRQCRSVGGDQRPHQQRRLGRIPAEKVLVGIDMGIVCQFLGYSVTFYVSYAVHNQIF